jgi:hypothetical protein
MSENQIRKSAAMKPTPKNLANPDILQVHEGTEGVTTDMSESDIVARISTRGYMTAHAMRAYAGFDRGMVSVTSMHDELRANGDAVVAGDLGRVERMMIAQAITLDTIFANLAERASRQEYVKNMETYLRLAMKAQSQCRATAEALALLKNPMPYIRQANIAQGPQQVNNGVPAPSQPHASDSSFTQSKLLESENGKYLEGLDTGAKAQAVASNPAMAAVEQVNRANVAKR